jgi:hypothetical protein
MAKLLSGTRIYGNTTIDTYVTVGANVTANSIYESTVSTTTRLFDSANLVINSAVSSNVATLRGEITSNAADANSLAVTMIAANLSTIRGEVTSNVATLNGSVTANVSTLRLNTDAYITTNVANLTANVINTRISANAATTNLYTNNVISTNVATLRGEITGNAALKVSKTGDTMNGPLYLTGASANLYAGTVTANGNLTAGIISGGNNGVMLYDAERARLGVNRSDPRYTLDVNGEGFITGNVIITGNLQVQGSFSTISSANLDVQTNVITMSAGLTTAITPTSNNQLVINRGNQSNTYLRWNEFGITGGQWLISSNGNTDGIIVSTENTFQNWSSFAAADAYKQIGLPIGGRLGWGVSNMANGAYATANAGYATANAGYATANAGYSTANAAYALANTSTTNITVIDDISSYFDGISRTFDLYAEANVVNILASEQILVQLGGMSIPPFINTYDIVFGSNFLAFTKGYSVANTGNVSQISFSSAPQTNMDCTIRVLAPNQITVAQTKRYPFSPIAIMTGY